MQAGTVMGDLTSAIGVRVEDAALVTALKAGSEEAFAVLIAQYSQPLYSLIARSLQDPSDATDITQEVFIKVFRSIRSFHGEASLRTWLYRIALREASNQRRWWSRHKRMEVTIDTSNGSCNEEGDDDGLCLSTMLMDPAISPYEQAAQAEIKAEVEVALRRLPEAFRTAIVLREMEGFAYEEIAEILDIPTGTVKSRLKRGRIALKAILVEEGLRSALAGGCQVISENKLPCANIRSGFSDYLDGSISGREMQTMANHLERCADCQEEFNVWRGLQRALAAAGPVKASHDLGLKLRLAISHESARRSGHWWDGLNERWDNLLRPALVQASAGLAGTLVLVGSIVLLIGVVATPQAVLANDEPLGGLTAPRYLYSAAEQQPVITAENTTIVIEADVNAAGSVYDYTIVSGPTDEATQTQIRNQLLLQVYAPARVFGEPVRGRVLITFAGVSVRA